MEEPCRLPGMSDTGVQCIRLHFLQHPHRGPDGVDVSREAIRRQVAQYNNQNTCMAWSTTYLRPGASRCIRGKKRKQLMAPRTTPTRLANARDASWAMPLAACGQSGPLFDACITATT